MAEKEELLGTEQTQNILEDTERLIFEELKSLSNDDDIAKKLRRLPIADRKFKAATVIVSFENLKERKFMNRTARKDVTRKIEKATKTE